LIGNRWIVKVNNQLLRQWAILLDSYTIATGIVNIVRVKSFVRNDLNGTWEENQIVQGSHILCFAELKIYTLDFNSINGV